MTYRLIYIGNEFYLKSGTMMSCIYENGVTGTGGRWDWGMVERFLREGHIVHIRPATVVEKRPYLRLLEKILNAEIS